MNIAFFLTPKANVKNVQAESPVSVGIELLRESGYTAIPVIDKEGGYAGVVSEGDFLWHLLYGNDKKVNCISDLVNVAKYKPVHITATMQELIGTVQEQNFVPVIDDRGFFMGIVTRKDVIKYMSEGDK